MKLNSEHDEKSLERQPSVEFLLLLPSSREALKGARDRLACSSSKGYAAEVSVVTLSRRTNQPCALESHTKHDEGGRDSLVIDQ